MLCYLYVNVCLSVTNTNHVWHTSDSSSFELTGEGWQAAGKSSLVLQLLLRVQLLAWPRRTLTVGLSSKRTPIAAQTHLEKTKR